MEAITLLTLPAEIHIIIARYCQNHDLINLCLTSKLLNERCLHVLYRHVDLQYGRNGLRDTFKEDYSRILNVQIRKTVKFLFTLTRHPEYGKHVGILEMNFHVPIRIPLERVMQSLTHVQHVDLVFQHFANFPEKHFPVRLFQSVTSVRLVGNIQYSLAKSVLNAVNPATLKHLCLDLVPDFRIGGLPHRFVPRDSGENARIVAIAVAQRLLTPLTGRFTALQTLILRSIESFERNHFLHEAAAAEEASYLEWASFIRSVQGTVEKFMFEQVQDFVFELPSPRPLSPWFETMDERFRRLLLPTIVSGNWPCLNIIELRGIRSSNGPGELVKELGAVLGEDVMIVVKEEPDSVHDYVTPYRWN